MSSIAIRTNQLGKRYRIGLARQNHDTLRDAVTDFLRAPLNRFRRLSGGEGSQEEMFWALKDVSFEVEHGEIVGIIGRNGAGKSTLLKILSRITEPTEGRAEIFGRVGSLLEVGTGFHPELTGRENIYLNGAILGMRKAEIDRKFDEIVAFAEVEKFLDTPVKRYSSGMFVRLAFAVAAFMNVDILIVDEVLSVGDIQFQKKCLGMMGDLTREGKTVLFVSHNMNAVCNLCTRLIWIDRGSIHMQGETNEIVSKYMTVHSSSNGQYSRNLADTPAIDLSIVIQEVSMKAHEGSICSSFDARDPITIEIVYDIVETVSNGWISIVIYTVDGVMVLTGGDADRDEYYFMNREPGRYITLCVVPGGVLNEGRYVLSVGSVQLTGAGPRQIEMLGNILELEIKNSAGAGKNLWFKRGGIISMKMDWTIQRMP